MVKPTDIYAHILVRLPKPLRSLRNVPLVGNILRSCSHLLLPDTLVWSRVERGPAAGLWLELNPRTGQVTRKGDGEPAVQKFLAEHLKPGMVFYDIGANIGFFSLLGARLVGETGKVLSFEPDHEAAARLRRNVQRNGFTYNTHIREIAVWSKSGFVNFEKDDSPDRGLGHVGKNGSKVSCVSLDELITVNPPPDVIKCDVEGAEVEVFRGAHKLLTSNRPVILCEVHSGENDQALRDYFQKLGYIYECVREPMDERDQRHMLARCRDSC